MSTTTLTTLLIYQESDSTESSSNGVGERVKLTRCLLHIGFVDSSALFCWEKPRWDTVLRVAKARRCKRFFESSKYKQVIESLPDQPSDCDGYHIKCYKNFTAITASSPSVDQFKPQRLARQKSCTTTGIFPDRCLFCDKFAKTRTNGTKEYLGQVLTEHAEETIRDVTQVLHLESVMTKISGVDLIAKEAKFHHSCRAEHTAKAARKRRALDIIPEEPNNSLIPMEYIFQYVQENIINDNRPEYLSSVFDRYTSICDHMETAPQITKLQYFGSVLEKQFKSNINLHTSQCKKSGTIVHNSELNFESVKAVYDYKTSPEGRVVEAALVLRSELKKVNPKPLGDPLTMHSLRRGEGTPPELVKTFFKTLLAGPLSNDSKDSIKRRVESMSQDALFIVKRGIVKPPKHIMLGMTLKSLTGSKQIITIINRLGSCLNYSAIEELETELAHSLIDQKRFCPDGAFEGVPAGLAFDNYDELTHTLSGADSLHDTMGIFYQNMTVPTSDGDMANKADCSTSISPTISHKKQRRTLDVPQMLIEPYRKKPRMGFFSYNNLNFRSLASTYGRAKKLDLLWLAAHALEIENIPMWAAFNSRHYVDKLPKQVVLYMPNMNCPPTRNDVVAETLKLTQTCARECGQAYGIVTYDLDVAKNAVRIQITERPSYDNIFIMYGSFHLMMCLFRAIGKTIAESGIPEMLTESDVLASGSLKGFLTCSNFNRCKRLHPMLALSFEILHFHNFLEISKKFDSLKDVVDQRSLTDENKINQLLETPIMTELFENYASFTKRTLDGEHGKTAQFVIQYVDRVKMYLTLDRAVRESDIELYICSLTDIIDLFFATNRVNYARWMSKYQLDLLNLDDTHPGLMQLLSNGLFSVRRTDNNFSRIPVDLTLEQTVNADAASRMTGYTAATNNYNARLRWSVTKGSRAAMVSATLDFAGLNKTNDPHSDLSYSRVRRDNRDLLKIISKIEESANPFNLDSDELINLNTGKCASQDVSHSLLNIADDGKVMHNKFIEECEEDPNRFEKTISLNKLRTFAAQGAKNRRTKNTTISQLKCTRDMFGRIAVLATQRAVDLEYLLTFPLTPVPLSVCRTDGTMVHTDKSALFSLLENKIQTHGRPESIQTHIIDGNFLLHCLPPHLPPTYGGLSRIILHSALQLKSRRVDIVFDTYEQPSIKDCERERRSAENTTYLITGPDQLCPKDLNKALKSPSFKKQLPKFLVRDWHSQHHSAILDGRELYIGVEEECTKFTVVNGSVQGVNVDNLTCNHPEADTRVCLHAKDADSGNVQGGIVVRACDTDILIILLNHVNSFNSEIWMEVGTSGRGNRRYISVSAIGKEIGTSICLALPGLHSFTGCDYTAAFARKGKKRPYGLLERDERFQKAFARLTSPNASVPDVKMLEEFVCLLYGAKKFLPLNKFRFKSFEKAFGPRNKSKPLAKLKGVDASSLPPCEAVIKQKIARARFVATMWNQAVSTTLSKLPGLQDGWEMVDENYSIIWFDCEQMPDSVVPSLHADVNEDENSDSDFSEDSSDSDD